MSDWHWQSWQGRPYLTCSLLSSWKHGFFTRHWSPALPEAISSVLDLDAQIYRVKQVHGDRVLVADQVSPLKEAPLGDRQAGGSDDAASPPAGRVSHREAAASTAVPAADGLVAHRAQQAVWVATADCVPALIGDRRTGRVAAVHAGWRGTAQKILPQAVARLLHQGSQRQDLRVALGPAIQGATYQVSTAVAARVGATLVPAPPDIDGISVSPPSDASAAENTASSESVSDVIAQLLQLPRSPLSLDPDPDRTRLDVRQVNRLQLEQMGLAPEQIAAAPYCTYEDGERFFSYRREALKKVQWSGIVSR